jgi:poly(A)-specific ribonuclease
MEVTASSFWFELPDILAAIAEADFVTLDFEMTGLQLGRLGLEKLSLEELYWHAKQVSGTFNIVQVGLTCVRTEPDGELQSSKRWKAVFRLARRANADKLSRLPAGCQPTKPGLESYSTKSFNINISAILPLSNAQERMISSIAERTVTFSSPTCHFLQRSGFSFDQAFFQGVTYLSRKEVVRSIEDLAQDAPSELKISSAGLDEQGRAFYESTQERLSDFRDARVREHDVLNISNPYGGRVNKIQSHITQQLVRSILPGYGTLMKNNREFMQIVKTDPEAERQALQRRTFERLNTVRRVSGFRYVVEALCGGNFADDIDANWLVAQAGDGQDPRLKQVEAMQEKLLEWQGALRSRSPVLVGHNLFFDLCFLYQTFIDDMPEGYETFRGVIHDLFPRIFDTKYMATLGEHSMMPDRSLADLFESENLPEAGDLRIVSEPDYFRKKGSAHQAGYDSKFPFLAVWGEGMSLSNCQVWPKDLHLCPCVVSMKAGADHMSCLGWMTAVVFFKLCQQSSSPGERDHKANAECAHRQTSSSLLDMDQEDSSSRAELDRKWRALDLSTAPRDGYVLFLSSKLWLTYGNKVRVALGKVMDLGSSGSVQRSQDDIVMMSIAGE